MEPGALREHYKKLQTIGDLFEEDRKALLELPINSFNACRYERIKTDATVSFVLRGTLVLIGSGNGGKRIGDPDLRSLC